MYERGGRLDRRRILLPVQILRAAPTTDLTTFGAIGLVDTGATSSGIAPSVVEALDLETYGKRPLGSARGEEQVRRYLFRLGLALPEDHGPAYPVVFEVDGFELRAGFAFDVIVGMDVLSRCELDLRHDRWVLRYG